MRGKAKVNSLADAVCRNAKAAEKTYKLADGGGLYLEVTPTGGKYWRWKYRFAGRERALHLGKYPSMSLQKARAARDAGRLTLEDGNDPAEAKRDEKTADAEAVANSFAGVAAQYIAKLEREGRAPATLRKLGWILSLLPALHDLPVGAIKPPEILAALKIVDERGHHETAQKARGFVGAVMRYAAAHGKVEIDPTATLRGALTRHRTRHRAAITNAAEFGGLMRAIDGYQGSAVVQIALLILANTAVRPGELRLAEWSEFDISAKVWSIPADRMKMRRPHKVPLSRQVLDLLEQLRALNGWSKSLLPSLHNSRSLLSENTMGKALRSLGYGPEKITPHGFRSAFSTLANESRLWHADAIERALAHADGDAVRRAYHRGEHWDERVSLAQWWSDFTDELKAAKGKLVALPKRK